MNIVVAVDSFKGSCSAANVAKSIEKGIYRAIPSAKVVKIPLSDGGEGLIETFLGTKDGRLVEMTVTGPNDTPVTAAYAVLSDGTAIIEMAQASGITLIDKTKHDICRATTFGTGELIRAALDEGCRNIIIGIGGSATNDGGAGMAQALGTSLLDENGIELKYGGEELKRLSKIDISGMHKAIKDARIKVACDVSNPLCGINGASRVYGPQKGAKCEDIEILDNALVNYASIISKQLHIDIAEIPGSGAAGGLGAGLLAFCGAKLISGMDIVCEILKVEEYLKDADLVITGEGKIDGQSIFGKVPCAIANRAKKNGIPVIGIAGALGNGYELMYKEGIDAMFSIVNKPMGLEEAMKRAEELIELATENSIRLYNIGMSEGRNTP